MIYAQSVPEHKMASEPKHSLFIFVAEHDFMWHGVSP